MSDMENYKYGPVAKKNSFRPAEIPGGTGAEMGDAMGT
ncbi:hypothetical protein SAMN05216505_102337 [Streptomyces prasinopilosus]|uniref:Uncharacterized protein n=1 Tax=Streptomyces prasinopilosus TaxID=67344 RepID=A0A1G6M134_9ACTN|nr:hypothetical protein SAMN05216505_102337 [Streptomyces prasinopilosus]